MSRRNLVDLATFCSTILLFHVLASWWLEARYRTWTNTSEGERWSVPRGETRRTFYYILFTFGVSIGALGLKVILKVYGSGIWQSKLVS